MIQNIDKASQSVMASKAGMRSPTTEDVNEAVSGINDNIQDRGGRLASNNDETLNPRTTTYMPFRHPTEMRPGGFGANWYQPLEN